MKSQKKLTFSYFEETWDDASTRGCRDSAGTRSATALYGYTAFVYLLLVIRSFGDAATAAIFHGRDTRVARLLSKLLWPRVRRVLDQLNAVRNVKEMAVPPSNSFEKLKGDLAGRYSVRVSDQFRVHFRFENGDAWEVTCEDYH
jgi:proteic killer suppression protein